MYRWQLCHGGTEVTILSIGGTNADLVEGVTNVGGSKVAASFFLGCLALLNTVTRHGDNKI
jgi:hypothetical protein